MPANAKPRAKSARCRWIGGGSLLLIGAWLLTLNMLAPPPAPSGAADPGGLDRRKVFGDDDRVKVDDPTAWPYSPIGQVRGAWGGVAFVGTGTLIAPDRVLTAAHCVYRDDLGGWADEVTFTPARSGGAAPFGTIRAIRMTAPQSYIDTRRRPYDVAIITLSEPIGDETGWHHVAGADVDPTRQTVYSAGYPADESGTTLYAVAGSTFELVNDVVQTDLDAYFGQSGSAVWVLDGEGQPVVIAVLAAELDDGSANVLVPVTTELVDRLAAGDDASSASSDAAGDGTGIAVGAPASPVPACGAGIPPLAMMAAAGLVVLRSIGRRDGFVESRSIT